MPYITKNKPEIKTVVNNKLSDIFSHPPFKFAGNNSLFLNNNSNNTANGFNNIVLGIHNKTDQFSTNNIIIGGNNNSILSGSSSILIGISNFSGIPQSNSVYIPSIVSSSNTTGVVLFNSLGSPSTTITVSSTIVKSNSIIIVTGQDGTISGRLQVTNKIAGISFDIISSSSETGAVGYFIINQQ